MPFKPICPVCGNPMMYFAVEACDFDEDCILETYHCEDCNTWDENHVNVYDLDSFDDSEGNFLEKD